MSPRIIDNYLERPGNERPYAMGGDYAPIYDAGGSMISVITRKIGSDYRLSTSRHHRLRAFAGNIQMLRKLLAAKLRLGIS